MCCPGDGARGVVPGCCVCTCCCIGRACKVAEGTGIVDCTGPWSKPPALLASHCCTWVNAPCCCGYQYIGAPIIWLCGTMEGAAIWVTGAGTETTPVLSVSSEISVSRLPDCSLFKPALISGDCLCVVRSRKNFKLSSWDSLTMSMSPTGYGFVLSTIHGEWSTIFRAAAIDTCLA